MVESGPRTKRQKKEKNLPTFSSREPLQIVALPTYSTTTPCGLQELKKQMFKTVDFHQSLL